MTFESFAEEHGLIIDRIVLDRWVRVPTQDKPHKRNGAYIWDGRGGAVINFAQHEKHIIYKGESPRYDPFIQDRIKKSEKERTDRQLKARKKAVFIVNNAVQSSHPYLEKKGFSKGLVWNNLLVVPMRIDGCLMGCQLITPEGDKKFLTGQVTKGASLTIDNKGRDILVEGLATGLSVRQVLKEHNKRYTIHICFSASNMVEIAKGKHNPLVIADHDPIGIKTAQKIGQYWLSDTEGEDFNDAHQRGYIGNIIALLE
jgi:putative DNA primase/helicase